MTDMLIRKIDPKLKRALEKRARAHGRSLSEEAKLALQRGLDVPEPPQQLGTFLFALLPDEFRGEDLVFHRDDVDSPPPDFR
ncbi:MAG: hypothetical protein IT536_20245 [Hyphomicrobiales bacterium]|nr:hypothetical protein [Hyphomicrobiales bacterium]